MSIFNDLLPKIIEIPKNSIKNINDGLEDALKNLQKLEDEYFRSKRVPEKALTITLQSIDEDDDESTKSPQAPPAKSIESSGSEQPSRRVSKRSKDQVDGMHSPAVDKRLKRSASVKAKTIISAQTKARAVLKERHSNEIIVVPDEESDGVNVNLSHKLRRESPDGRKKPLPPPIKIKQEKISLPPPTPEAIPPAEDAPVTLPPSTLAVKLERLTAAEEMPPPIALPKRGRQARPRSSQQDSADESTRRSARGRKPKELDYPPTASTRSSRANSRASSRANKGAEEPKVSQHSDAVSDAESMPPPLETRPKRTRAKKKLSESSNTDAEKENAPVNVVASPTEKPRPKRTRRGQKAAEKEAEATKPATPKKQKEIVISPKEERISEPQPKIESPVIQTEKDVDGRKERQGTKEKNETLQKQNAVDVNSDSKDQPDKKLQKQNQETKKPNAKLLKQNSDLGKPNTKLQTQNSDERVLQKQNSEPDTYSKKLRDVEKQSTNLQKQDTDLDKLDKKRLQRTNTDLEQQNTILQKQNTDLELQKQVVDGKQTKVQDKKKNKQDNKQVEENKVVEDVKVQDKKKNKQDNKQVEENKVVEDVIQNETITLQALDSTIVLTNGVYDHPPVTPQNIRCANATVTLARDTLVLAQVNDETVVLHTDTGANVTDDASLLTEDGDKTPEQPLPPPPPEPTSAVKQKVQQFEQLAARTTRTKTRQQQAQADHTPPNTVVPSSGITMDTLNKMNNMIFNGKPPQSSSALKPRAIPPPKTRPASASASKATALSRNYEESVALKEDARKKKEALLEAKREQQRRKREEKIAAAAAAREAAERDRRIAMEAAARERQEKQAHADQGKIDRLKEVERKKAEQARKAAEIEERRRAEEQARQQRLLEEARRADAAKRKQQEEAEAMRKEAMTAKEIEKRQKEYIERQKMKQRMEQAIAASTRTPVRAVSPTYMCDGFQYLDSDEDHSPKARPTPEWNHSKARRHALSIQAELPHTLVDRLFCNGISTPDLREIFPGISKHRLVRTSSAVWRTPPKIDPLVIARLEQVSGGV